MNTWITVIPQALLTGSGRLPSRLNFYAERGPVEWMYPSVEVERDGTAQNWFRVLGSSAYFSTVTFAIIGDNPFDQLHASYSTSDANTNVPTLTITKPDSTQAQPANVPVSFDATYLDPNGTPMSNVRVNWSADGAAHFSCDATWADP